ncbi:tetratricopeptide repeat protein [Muricauda sp. MAR_2010_75]|uniref:tetratricopeptide repeat protein n=1 Tax=Allomuricauda sp. MAR_2010_75 TaxID=1250232 RepID=UPI0005620709|nr:tetratricopeptide repeat protein [Muricauda sp. MAR_2010_75]
MKHPKILFIALLVFPILGLCQNKIDSLSTLYNQSKAIDKKVDVLKQIFNIQLYVEPVKAKQVISELLEISRKENYTKGVATANYGLGSYHFITQAYDSATYYYRKALAISKENDLPDNLVGALSGLASVKASVGDYYGAIKLNDSLLPLFRANGDYLNYGVALGNTALYYNNMGQYDRAMEGYIAALAVLDTIAEEPFRRADILRGVGRINYDQENYETALDYFDQALSVYRQTEDNLYQSYTLNNMGNTYSSMGETEAAIEHYQKSLVISKAFNYEDNTANVLANLGSTYRDMGKYDLALEHLLKALEISKTGNSMDNVASQLGEIGKTYVDRNEISKGISYLNESIVLADSVNAKNYELWALAYRAEAHKKNNDYKLAFEDQKRYQALNDSLFNADKTKQIEQLRTLYETEQKEAEIALQEEEINTLNAQAKVDQLTKGLYAGGMASALALSGLLVFGFRQRMKKNRMAREKQEEIYKQEIEHKKKELASQTLHLVQKNTFIQELMENLESIKNSPEKFKMEFRRIVMLLKKENASDKDWEVFKTYFAEVHNDFDQKLKTLYSDISEKEIRLAAFLRMNLTTKEIAATLNVLPDSILKSKYRLKKKLGLDKETDLTTFLNTL